MNNDTCAKMGVALVRKGRCRLTVVRALESEEIRRALRVAVEGVIRHAGDAHAMAAKLADDLRSLSSPPSRR